MLESEERNRAFDGDSGSDTPSSLNIEQKWSLFDAAVIVPAVERFVFFESRLGAYIGRWTTYFMYVMQVMRNLKSASFLCHHPASVYRGWDFGYVAICPREGFEYRLAYHAGLFDDVALHLNLFRDILTTEYATLVGQERLDRSYDQFRQLVPGRIAVRHWDPISPHFASRSHFRRALTGGQLISAMASPESSRRRRHRLARTNGMPSPRAPMSHSDRYTARSQISLPTD
jgi:hypothetical protein